MPADDPRGDRVAALMNAGRFAEAAQVLEEILGTNPGWSVGWLNLGLCRIRLRQGDSAMRALEEGLRLDPVRPRVRLSLADAAILQGRPDRAIHWCREECRQFPGETGSWVALGMAFERVDHPETGDAYREALRLSPGDPGVVAHLGRWLHHQHDLIAAMALLDPVRRLHPEHGRLQWQWTVNCFLRGDITLGLRHLDCRLAVPDFPRSRALDAVPVWSGGTPTREPILVEPEQGYGDTIQFLRFVPELVRLGHRVWLGLPRALERLVGNSMDVERIITGTEPAAGVGVRIPILSLPARLGVRGEDLCGDPYLPTRRSLSMARRKPGGPLTVGLVWRGNPQHANDRRRSLSLRQLHPLLRLPGIDWVSLQWGEDTHDEIERAVEAGCRIRRDPTPDGDFQDSADRIRRTDLVLSVDTALCHLAGALGHPVWTLLPYNPDWRWGLTGEQTPWYRSMRLYRQEALDSWGEPIARLEKDLRAASPSGTD